MIDCPGSVLHEWYLYNMPASSLFISQRCAPSMHCLLRCWIKSRRNTRRLSIPGMQSTNRDISCFRRYIGRIRHNVPPGFVKAFYDKQWMRTWNCWTPKHAWWVSRSRQCLQHACGRLKPLCAWCSSWMRVSNLEHSVAEELLPATPESVNLECKRCSLCATCRHWQCIFCLGTLHKLRRLAHPILYDFQISRCVSQFKVSQNDCMQSRKQIYHCWQLLIP